MLSPPPKKIEFQQWDIFHMVTSHPLDQCHCYQCHCYRQKKRKQCQNIFENNITQKNTALN